MTYRRYCIYMEKPPPMPAKYACAAIFLIAGITGSTLASGQVMGQATGQVVGHATAQVTGQLAGQALNPGRSSALPNLGDGEELSLSAERRLGQRVMREIYRDPDYLDDPVLGDYLQSIWQPLLAASRARGELSPEMDERFAWQPFLVRERSVNAFALPGGYMGVHLGLVALVNSRDELASVLGHEMSHITQRHIARASSKQARQTPLLMAALLLGVLAASKSPDAANAAIAGSMAVGQQNQLNFSRDMEREADRIGFSVMTGAGFDGRGFVSMFDKLGYANRINDNGSFPYLRSHPLTTERIADAQLRLAQPMDALAAPLAPSAEPLMMAARAKVLANPGVDVLRAMVADAGSPAAQTQLEGLPRERRAAAYYGAIVAKLRLKEFASMAALQSRLAQLTAPDAQAFNATTLLAVEVALAQGDARRALLLLPPVGNASSATRLADGGLANVSLAASVAMPNAPRAALLMAAQAHSMLGGSAELEEAAAILQTRVALAPQDALAWQNLSAVYQRQGLIAHAVRADAEARVAELDYSAAQDRFKAAQAMLRNRPRGAAQDDIEASIIDTRTRQVALLLREQALER